MLFFVEFMCISKCKRIKFMVFVVLWDGGVYMGMLIVILVWLGFILWVGIWGLFGGVVGGFV